MYEILRPLAIFMIILGACSGIALFFIAVSGSDKLSKSSSTLWGLFIIGIVAGIILLASIR